MIYIRTILRRRFLWLQAWWTHAPREIIKIVMYLVAGKIQSDKYPNLFRSQVGICYADRQNNNNIVYLQQIGHVQ